MGAINDIGNVLKHRKNNGLPDVKLIAMDIDKFNTLFIELQDEIHPHYLGNPNIKSRLEEVNAIMLSLNLPEIALLQ